jgi:spore coat protein U-like protein
MSKKLLITVAGTAALLVASPALAGSATVDINAKLDVIDGCVINGGAGVSDVQIDFGTVQNIAAVSTDIDAQTGPTLAGINVSCNVSSTTAAFEIGKGVNGSTTVRTLTNPAAVGTPGEFVAYHLYSNAARTSAFEYRPDGTTFPVNGGVITAGVPFSIIVYGRILNGDANNAVAGSYTDTASGTLTF